MTKKRKLTEVEIFKLQLALPYKVLEKAEEVLTKINYAKLKIGDTISVNVKFKVQ